MRSPWVVWDGDPSTVAADRARAVAGAAVCVQADRLALVQERVGYEARIARLKAEIDQHEAAERAAKEPWQTRKAQRAADACHETIDNYQGRIAVIADLLKRGAR